MKLPLAMSKICLESVRKNGLNLKSNFFKFWLFFLDDFWKGFNKWEILKIENCKVYQIHWTGIFIRNVFKLHTDQLKESFLPAINMADTNLHMTSRDYILGWYEVEKYYIEWIARSSVKKVGSLFRSRQFFYPEYVYIFISLLFIHI